MQLELTDSSALVNRIGHGGASEKLHAMSMARMQAPSTVLLLVMVLS